MKSRGFLAIFNRGIVSKLALARAMDIDRVAMSAETQTNWMPRSLGSMMLRPGLGYVATLADDGALLPFVKASDDTAIIALSPSKAHIYEEGTTLLTRPAVTAAITNGDFTTDLSGWTDSDEIGGLSIWSSGSLLLIGDGFTSAIRTQSVAVTAGEENTLHALRIVVGFGRVLLRIVVGTTTLQQAVLRAGTHSIAFTPGASSFSVQFSTHLKTPATVDSCHIEGAGTLELPTLWTTADACKSVRWAQSEDVIFCAGDGVRPQRIERRDNSSWSVTDYTPNDGPYKVENTGATTITSSTLAGITTLTASKPVFKAGHVGAIFKLTSNGQYVGANLSSESSYSDYIRVTGVGTNRAVSITISGTFSGTLTLQRSIGAPGAWTSVATYGGAISFSYNDLLDNSIIYYRFMFRPGDYTSGTATVVMDYEGGSIDGVARVTAFTSETSVTAVVEKPLGGTSATAIWAEGAWSSESGWPTAVAIWEGRLCWAGDGQFYATQSEAFDTFDPETEGDSAPITKRVGAGSASAIRWLAPMQRLVAGTDGEEQAIRSTSFDEPLTLSNYNAKPLSARGSLNTPAATIGPRGYFIDRSGWRVLEMAFDNRRADYATQDMTVLIPEIAEGGFVRLGIQRTPDMRVHAIKGNGDVAVLVRDEAEDVLAWVNVETDGVVEDVVVLPGDIEDQVFYRVRRTIDGSTVRYLEKWAREDEAQGDSLSKVADSFVTGTGPVSTLTGLDHLEGESVVVWADGVDKGTFTVSSGAVALGESVTDWCAGLPYTATYKSTKLVATINGLGPTIMMRSRIDRIGLLLAHTHAAGLKYGPDFNTLDDLPLIEDADVVDADAIHASYDQDIFEFPGDWDTDNRICLQAAAPRPCTVMGVVMTMDRHDAP